MPEARIFVFYFMLLHTIVADLGVFSLAVCGVVWLALRRSSWLAFLVVSRFSLN